MKFIEQTKPSYVTNVTSKPIEMNYQFPGIRTIDDVLPFIEGRQEFVVANKGDYTVINYMVEMHDTFTMENHDDYSAIIRRECRGLIFDRDGNIMSRPFHKFFNLNQREETLESNVDLSQHHTVYEKLDGSMIRPLIIDNQLVLATKMGVTDIGIQALAWLLKQPNAGNMIQALIDCVEEGFTPIFEFISPKNKIVVNYEKEDLVLLAVRITIGGDYIDFNNTNLVYHFNSVPSYGSTSKSLKQFVDSFKNDQNREGVVVMFDNGHMIKIKCDEYVVLHKIKEDIQSDRHIAELIVNDMFDDIVAKVDKTDKQRMIDFQNKFDAAVKIAISRLTFINKLVKHSFGNDKKRVALEVVPCLEKAEDAKFLFAVIDGRDLVTEVKKYIAKNVINNYNYKKVSTWLDIS